VLVLYFFAEVLVDSSFPESPPEATTRIVEILTERNGSRNIINSEWGYLGAQPISIEEREDEDDIFHIKFASNDDRPRLFVAEEPDDPEYFSGDVFEDGEIIGTFTLRKISGITSAELWPKGKSH